MQLISEERIKEISVLHEPGRALDLNFFFNANRPLASGSSFSWLHKPAWMGKITCANHLQAF
jgi:hypothetical protein